MFSAEFMKYLINYQKDDFVPEKSTKVIYFRNNSGGRLAEIFAIIKK